MKRQVLGNYADLNSHKSNMLYDFIYITFLKDKNYIDTGNVSGCRELRVGGGFAWGHN